MGAYPSPEADRLQVLEDYRILDTPPEEVFDRITRLASQLFSVPICLISLVDRRREWIKSACGLAVHEVPAEVSFGAQAIQSKGVLVVPDARQDSRFRDNPLVTGPSRVSFYAGAPLKTPKGCAIGVLSILDGAPWERLGPDQESCLLQLARTVVDLLELRRQAIGNGAGDGSPAEEYLRLTVENSPLGMATLDLDGRLRSVNPAFCRLFGYSESELVGTQVAALSHADDLDLARRHFSGLLQSEAATCEVEKKCIRKGGAVVNVIVRAGTVRNAEGRPLFVVATVEDITERKRAEGALRRSEERYRRMVEASSDAIFVHKEGRIVYANPACLKLFHAASPDQILGKSPLEFVHPDYRDLERERLRALQTPWTEAPLVEEKFIRPDGSVVDVEVAAIALSDPDTTAVQTEARDITTRKHAEEALSRLAAIVQGSQDAIIGFTLDGRVESWNQAAERLYGYTVAEVLGRSYSVLMKQRQWEELVETLDKIRRGEAVTSYETMRTAKNGRVVPVSVTVSPIRYASGEIVGLAAIGRDIRDRKKAESEIRIINKLLHELSGQLLRTQDEERRRIARELHDSTAQTLAALTMNLSLLRGTPPVAVFSATSELVAESLKLAEQCSREVRAISYLLHPPLLDELGLASALRTYVEGFSQRTGIRVSLDLPPERRRLTPDIEMTLFRIVQEGLANVHRHSRSSRAFVRLRQGSDHVELDLEDEGCGIPSQVLEEQSPGRVQLGVGIMGMRERAAQLGGRLDIDTREGGTTVRVLLPLRG